MNICEDIFDSYGKNDVKQLIKRLETVGYIIDGQEEDELCYSSAQLECMSNEAFAELCNKYNFSCEVELSTTGNYYPCYGNILITFNQRIHNLNAAKKILDDYAITLAY